MSDLDDFIKEHNLKPEKSKKSVLAPYQDEIFKMKEMGFTEKIILQFLKEKKGISVSQQTLNWFIRSRKNDTKPISSAQKTPVKAIQVKTDKLVIHKPHTNQVEHGSPRKFEWGETPSDAELFGSSDEKQPQDDKNK